MLPRISPASRSATKNFDQLQKEHLTKLLWSEQMAREGFEISREPWARVFEDFKQELAGLLATEEKPDLKPVVKALERLVKTWPGDPAFLKAFHESLDKQVKMLGLYARDITDQSQTIRFDFRDCSTEELLMLRSFAQAQVEQQQGTTPVTVAAAPQGG